VNIVTQHPQGNVLLFGSDKAAELNECMPEQLAGFFYVAAVQYVAYLNDLTWYHVLCVHALQAHSVRMH
jgi:hypothetical protein